ncbi:MAG: hypothetical protein GF344_06975, partial [Chitinivibrionales bacterium]|nr:hypothetical protein [Chitinivibrionales bacterium]
MIHIREIVLLTVVALGLTACAKPNSNPVSEGGASSHRVVVTVVPAEASPGIVTRVVG